VARAAGAPAQGRTQCRAEGDGDDQPYDVAEQFLLAGFYQYKKRYAAAVFAAAGQGTDADKLDAKEKARLRQQALAWLRDNHKEYAKQLAAADVKTRQAVQQTLQHWQKDADLASVRGKEALAKLPEAERAAWQQLWADVETLLKKARAKRVP
jgi:hypothetical protein